VLRNAEKLSTVTEKAECRVDVLTDHGVFDQGRRITRLYPEDEVSKCVSILVANVANALHKAWSVLGIRLGRQPPGIKK
jgi:hypothetical protein